MDRKTIKTLLALNREFYTAFARPFADSRPASDRVLTSILPYIPQRASVLDVGCGNGRLAMLLDRERPGTTYVGVDAVAELIKTAQARVDQLSHIAVTLRIADVTRSGWTKDLPIIAFDRAFALAVLHHIPSFDLRARVLRDIAGVLEPDGQMVISTWQFLANARMRRKIVPWRVLGISEDELEPGDYLLDWKRGGRGLRYCHLVDGEEMERLAGVSGLQVNETFRAGGREGNLSLFAVLTKSYGQGS